VTLSADERELLRAGGHHFTGDGDLLCRKCGSLAERRRPMYGERAVFVCSRRECGWGIALDWSPGFFGKRGRTR
jgi:hypothetical protein